MKCCFNKALSAPLLAIFTFPCPAVDRYVSLDGNHVPPFLTWADAATNIQTAIDAASDGDVIWVTNGVYNTGGKVMAGNLTNRVTLDKALTVRSVNGPFVTIIEGAGATNGSAAVRCAWLTNGATLSGFTVRGGATRTSGDFFTLSSGGGIWCASSNEVVIANCLVISNTAYRYGGGSYRGTIVNSAFIGNSGIIQGTAAYQSRLANCTVVYNRGTVSTPATFQSSHTNCIVYHNTGGNHGQGTFSHTCTTPLPPGPGNITNAPLLLPDNLHLSSDSPCRGAGTYVVSGTDIDGQPWADPPSMGCDEWVAVPNVVVQPQVQYTLDPAGFSLKVVVAGQEPFTCWWYREGVLLEEGGRYSSANTTNLVVNGVDWYDPGQYYVVVSNAHGMATSAVAQVVIYCVNAANLTPAPPYTSWATAATNIQDAIDAAPPGAVVLVTNGIYAAGGESDGHGQPRGVGQTAAGAKPHRSVADRHQGTMGSRRPNWAGGGPLRLDHQRRDLDRLHSP